MNIVPRTFKFRGMIAPQDTLHAITETASGATTPNDHYLAPKTVPITVTNPPPSRMIGIPQYSPTIVGTTSKFDPAADCTGNFMSCKFQANNNCYAYACNIASNTFPQPGRASGNLITAPTLNGPAIRDFAQQDGLRVVGTTIADVKTFAQEQITAKGALAGHFVALMISPAKDANWPGDYHWARCDDNVNFASWSQKDGGDQITNFDFAGHAISDPAVANWTVNLGPVQPNDGVANSPPSDLFVDYSFYCYMFVPDIGVNII